MTRTIAKRLGPAPGPAALAAALAVLVAVSLGGCAGGLIGSLPPVTRSSQASNVTVFRDASWAGFVGTVVLRVDGRETFRIWRNQEFSFLLDPGEYIFYWTIGFNECRRVAFISRAQSYRFRLAPNCVGFEDRF